MQFCSDPSWEQDTHALPDCEVFEVTYQEFIQADRDTWQRERMDNECLSSFQNAATLKGWYWWLCLPGCLPDGEPNGPFATEEEAIKDAQNQD